jgi:putative FmdB family regulatory protein
MPIYEYRCSSCGFVLELIQKIGEAAPENCPECQNQSLKKQVSAASFRLKGSGWYETDFKTGNKRQLADSHSEEQSGPAKSEKKGAEVKEKTKTSVGEEKSLKKTTLKSRDSKSSIE